MNLVRLDRLILIASFCALAICSRALCDGGMVIDRGGCGQYELVAFIDRSPSVGAIDLSVLAIRDGAWSAGTEISFVAVGPTGVSLRGGLKQNPSGDRLLRSSTLKLKQEGEWRVTLCLNDDPLLKRSFTMSVGPALAKWESLLGWMLLWIPCAGVLVAREVLIRRQQLGRAAWLDKHGD